MTPRLFDLAEFGDRLKKSRKREGLTLQELAAKSGISQAYIWQLEAGRSEPSLRFALRLAWLLGVDVEWLACGEGGDANCTAQDVTVPSVSQRE